MKSLIALLALLLAGSHGTPTSGTFPDPPEFPREMRGAWIATVGNMDWPSRPGLPVERQKAELIRILDIAERLRLNAVMFQVRPAGDAFYKSELEPWSQYLTGTMGKAPEPFYDPLEFAIAEAHKRGLELHAWFNPFRARYSMKGSVSAKHISKRKPSLTKRYGPFLWMDPGEREVRVHSLRVIEDVVRRYDIDGVHIDDYFYPYQQHDRRGRLIPFPDESSWRKYRAAGGTLTRANWRRHNVDTFVEDLYTRVKAIKSDVKVGISPFGIWRPGHPSGVVGLDSYAEIFADSRKWLREGWLDYIVPQLYWRTSAPQQPYADLLNWWSQQNLHQRHLWAGNAAYRILFDQQQWPAGEILEQIRLTREAPGASGNVHFNFRSLLQNRDGLSDSLAVAAYADDALVPATPWLDSIAPPPPAVRLHEHPLLRGTLVIEPAAGEQPFVWAMRARYGNNWHTEVLPASQTTFALMRGDPAAMPDEVLVVAVDRSGNESAVAMLAGYGRAPTTEKARAASAARAW